MKVSTEVSRGDALFKSKHNRMTPYGVNTEKERKRYRDQPRIADKQNLPYVSIQLRAEIIVIIYSFTKDRTTNQSAGILISRQIMTALC